MNPWVLLDEVDVPGDGGAMKLYQRAFEFSISVKNEELMNSRMHGSEVRWPNWPANGWRAASIRGC